MQFADKAVFAPGEAREDWTILRALADALGVSVGFDSFAQLQRRDDRRSAARSASKGSPITAALPAGRQGQARRPDRLSGSRTST